MYPFFTPVTFVRFIDTEVDMVVQNLQCEQSNLPELRYRTVSEYEGLSMNKGIDGSLVSRPGPSTSTPRLTFRSPQVTRTRPWGRTLSSVIFSCHSESTQRLGSPPRPSTGTNLSTSPDEKDLKGEKSSTVHRGTSCRWKERRSSPDKSPETKDLFQRTSLKRR